MLVGFFRVRVQLVRGGGFDTSSFHPMRVAGSSIYRHPAMGKWRRAGELNPYVLVGLFRVHPLGACGPRGESVQAGGNIGPEDRPP